MIKIFKSKKVFSWCFFDFGISSYPTLILTFFYGAFYAKAIAKNPTIGTAYWGFSISLASILSFLLLSFFLIQSRFYFQYISTSFFKMFFYALLVSVSALFFFDSDSSTYYPLIFVISSFIAFEFVNLFYNISLQKVAPKNNEGIVSNLGWATGYFGGLMALMFVYFFIKYTENSDYQFFNISVFHLIGPFVATWSFIFCLSHFKNYKSEKFAIPDIFKLTKSLKNQKIRFFLLSFFFLNNGIVCIFSFASMFAAFIFGLSESEIIFLGIFINLSGIIGCLSFGFIEKKFNSMEIVKLCIGALLILTSILFFTEAISFFWLIALAIGFFIGPIQASSRAFLAENLKENDQLTIFSFYSIIGNVCAVLGPFVIGIVVDINESIRTGMLIIPLFFFLSLIPFLRLSMLEISNSSKNH